MNNSDCKQDEGKGEKETKKQCDGSEKEWGTNFAQMVRERFLKKLTSNLTLE